MRARRSAPRPPADPADGATSPDPTTTGAASFGPRSGTATSADVDTEIDTDIDTDTDTDTDTEADADADASAGDTATATLERPSKTRRKQASHALQDLGAAAVELPPQRLAALAIAEPLRDAIVACRSIRAHEARRRQMQYIGKLMRLHDVAPIQHAVDEIRLGRARDDLALHEVERWRAELIADDGAATRWLAEHPGQDAQQLRALVRNARKDAALAPEQRNGRAYRELFRFVRAARSA